MAGLCAKANWQLPVGIGLVIQWMRTSKELSFYTRVQGFKELLLDLVTLLLCLVILRGISRTQGVIPY